MSGPVGITLLIGSSLCRMIERDAVAMKGKSEVVRIYAPC
jgi:hypothetical protein